MHYQTYKNDSKTDEKFKNENDDEEREIIEIEAN